LEDILNAERDVRMWSGGDIYTDIDNREALRRMFDGQNEKKGYKKLIETTDVISTFNNHCLNGGAVWNKSARIY